MIKKIFLISLFLFASTPFVGAKDCETLTDEFEKYQCRSDNVCKQYDENKKASENRGFRWLLRLGLNQ